MKLIRIEESLKYPALEVPKMFVNLELIEAKLRARAVENLRLYAQKCQPLNIE